MRDEPDIVKDLRKQEKEGTLHSKVYYNRKLPEGAEKTLHSLINLIEDPIVIVDSKGKFLEVSDKVFDLVGQTRDELIGKNFMSVKFISAKNKAILIKNLTKRMLGEHVDKYEINITNKDGKEIPTQVRGMKISYFDKPADLVILRDISDYKKTEEALWESQEKYKHIVENLSDVIMLTRPNGVISYVSPSCKEIFGYDPKDLEGEKFTINYPEDNKKLDEMIKKALKGEKINRFQYRIKTKNGETRWVSQSWSPIFKKDELQLIVSIITDVTKSKSADKELKNKINELEKFQDLTVDRELKMIELKKEVNELCEKNGEKPRYIIKEEVIL